MRPRALYVGMTNVFVTLSILGCLAVEPVRAVEPRKEQSTAPQKPLVRVVDLDVGETTQLELCNGQRVKVELLNLRELRDPIRQAVRSAMVTVKVEGEELLVMREEDIMAVIEG